MRNTSLMCPSQPSRTEAKEDQPFTPQNTKSPAGELGISAEWHQRLGWTPPQGSWHNPTSLQGCRASNSHNAS